MMRNLASDFAFLQLHQEFLSDQQKIRTELLTQFKDELDTTRLVIINLNPLLLFILNVCGVTVIFCCRAELEEKYRESLKVELGKMAEKHRKEISSIKKKQWYFCCLFLKCYSISFNMICCRKDEN